jgi:hypothetical protein
VYNPKTKVVDRYSSVVFDENRKGGELLDSSRNQEQLRLEEEDTIVVQTRASEPYEDSDEDTIVVQLYSPQEEVRNELPDPPQRIEGAGEATANRQSRSGRQIRLPERYQVRQVTTEIATPITYEEAVSGPQKKQWETAISDELRSLAVNNV